MRTKVAGVTGAICRDPRTESRPRCLSYGSSANAASAKQVQNVAPRVESACSATGPSTSAGRYCSRVTITITANVLNNTEHYVNAVFDLASKLVRAKDPQEVFALQSEYLKSQMAALQSQAQEFGAVIQKSVTQSSR